jgi:hemerythrin-like metal-binding protein
VGDDTIDAEHKQLILIVSELHRAMLQGKAREVLAEILDKLIRYTDSHFADEENSMRLRAYPRFSAHAAEHRRLSSIGHKLQADFNQGRLSITVETISFLKTWLSGHMLGMDQDYAGHIRNMKGKQAF